MSSAAEATPRPHWATAMSLFCLGSLAFLVANDLRDSPWRDTEVWLGLELHGPAARLTAPLHWAIFAVGAHAYWTRRPWALLATSLYLAYVGVSHLIWNASSPNGSGWRIGLLQAAFFSGLGAVFLRAHRKRVPL